MPELVPLSVTDLILLPFLSYRRGYHHLWKGSSCCRSRSGSRFLSRRFLRMTVMSLTAIDVVQTTVTVMYSHRKLPGLCSWPMASPRGWGGDESEAMALALSGGLGETWVGYGRESEMVLSGNGRGRRGREVALKVLWLRGRVCRVLLRAVAPSQLLLARYLLAGDIPYEGGVKPTETRGRLQEA